jgi:hypothetical protein
MKYFLILIGFLSFGANAQYAQPCAEVPELNKAILDVLRPYIGKKIARGECWDAAQLALNTVGAKWDGLYDYGREINIKTECIQPGDIIQLENVKVEVIENGGGYTETFGHHTAIVYKVNGPGDLELLHQNTGQFGRKMGVTTFNLKNKKSGTMTFFRPEK